MGTTTLIPVEEYLHTSYRPDRDYVDGLVLERNLGGRSHSKLQKLLTLYFGTRERELGITVWTEWRVQVKPTRFRVPDVCIVRGPEPEEPILTSPPYACFEILSPEDRLAEMEERVADYLAFGVPYVWIVDPERKKIYRSEAGRRTEVVQIETDLFTIGPEILFPS